MLPAYGALELSGLYSEKKTVEDLKIECVLLHFTAIMKVCLLSFKVIVQLILIIL